MHTPSTMFERKKMTHDDMMIRGCHQGARWDLNGGTIAESKLKELHPMMPVMYVKVFSQRMSNLLTHKRVTSVYDDTQAVTQDISDKQDTKNLYDTPIYKTRQRGGLP